MLQNRVTPYGQIIKTTARGAWMGNRGLLHNDDKTVVRDYKLKAWLTCVLEFKDRQRIVMAPRRYTELFFLDEATAFAAGHRPCFECRRDDHQRFKTLWLKGNAVYGFTESTSIQQIDAIIHRERIDGEGLKVTYQHDLSALPEGCFIEWENKPCLILKGLMFPWTPFGYDLPQVLPDAEQVKVLTPRSIVNTFGAGYLPQVATVSL